MRQPYHDLYKLAEGRRPLWFDEEGVPRWVPFEPGLVNDIYADEVALLEIECQSCGQRFKVALSYYRLAHICMGRHEPLPSLSERRGELCWGDPPCFMNREGKLEQCAGSTMSSDTIRVIGIWTRETGEWKKVVQ